MIKKIKNALLPSTGNFFSKNNYYKTLLGNAYSKSAAAFSSRNISTKKTTTWECSGFSQNGEDGIIDCLMAAVINPNKYFIEIGTGNGLENNTSYLAHVKGYSGIQIEGNPVLHQQALQIKPWLVEAKNVFVDENYAEHLIAEALFKNPDIFSLDIDGNDYYILKSLLDRGLTPKVIVVEYNSAFGEEMEVTIPYNPNFNMFETDFPYLYYGVSLNGWRRFLGLFGYTFLTVESNGVNAFFVKKDEFENGFFEGLQTVGFKENKHQLRTFKTDHKGQFEIMRNMNFVTIN